LGRMSAQRFMIVLPDTTGTGVDRIHASLNL